MIDYQLQNPGDPPLTRAYSSEDSMPDQVARKAAQQYTQTLTYHMGTGYRSCSRCGPDLHTSCEHWNSFMASALAPTREALQALVDTYGDYSRAAEFVEAMAKAERLVKGEE